MKRVNLLYLSNANTGGWPTFVSHLAQGLHALGVETRLLRVSNRTEDKVRPFGRSMVYRNVSLSEAVRMSCINCTLIVAMGQHYLDQAEALLATGALIVLHDPTEAKGDAARVLRGARRIIVPREANVRLAASLSDTSYIPHPFVRSGVAHRPKRWSAITIGRVDWDKYTQVVLKAFDRLDGEWACRVFGSVNRMYEHHALPDGWRERYYGGTYSTVDLFAAQRLAVRSRYVVDMSAIKGDGGGTQYAFLEALDVGARLVCNEAWLTGDPELDVMMPCAEFVKDDGELADVITDGWASDKAWHERQQAGYALLGHHEAKHVAQHYVDAMNDV